MTTIATDGKSMAGDSLTTAGNDAIRYAPKVKRLSDGRIAGCAGNTTECQILLRWLDGGGEKPTISDETYALILNPDGTAGYIDHKFEYVEYSLPVAIGSGADFAIGAMLAGKSPKDAVQIACVRDVKSGGEVTAVELLPPVPVGYTLVAA